MVRLASLCMTSATKRNGLASFMSFSFSGLSEGGFDFRSQRLIWSQDRAGKPDVACLFGSSTSFWLLRDHPGGFDSAFLNVVSGEGY